MFAPEVNSVGDDFADAYSNIVKVDSFSYATMNTTVGRLSPDPDWLGSVRTRLAMLSAASQGWQQDRPNIWSKVLLPFADYASTFSAFAGAVDKFGDNKDLWIQALDQLAGELQKSYTMTKAAESAFTSHIKDIQNIEPLLNQTIDTAWNELASEEQQMIQLASQITHLQDQVDQLQDSITNAEISTGKGYVQSVVSISYTLVTSAGVEIPYLAIAGLVLTVGKMAYDLIVTDKEIADTINQIVDLRVKASETAQAAAMTKSIIQLITSLDNSLVSTQSKLPAFYTMWSNERGKILQAKNAIQSGSDPSLMVDLATMPAAAATWNQLAGYVPKLSQVPEQGKPVSLTTTRQS